RLDGVMWQDARDGEVYEGSRHFFKRGKQPAWKHTGPGDDLPNPANDSKRKNIAGDQAQAFGTLGGARCFTHIDRNGILHRRLISSHAPCLISCELLFEG